MAVSVSYTHLDVYKRQETTSTNNDNPEDTKLLSPEAVRIFLYFLIYAIPLLFAQIGGDAVSYTHLDVYKRQGEFLRGSPQRHRTRRLSGG